MSPRIATAVGVVAVAVIGTWLKTRRTLRALAPVPVAPPDVDMLAEPLEIPRIEVDDDEAAEIIRRARPALERAREVE